MRLQPVPARKPSIKRPDGECVPSGFAAVLPQAIAASARLSRSSSYRLNIAELGPAAKREKPSASSPLTPKRKPLKRSEEPVSVNIPPLNLCINEKSFLIMVKRLGKDNVRGRVERPRNCGRDRGRLGLL